MDEAKNEANNEAKNEVKEVVEEVKKEALKKAGWDILPQHSNRLCPGLLHRPLHFRLILCCLFRLLRADREK